MQQALVPLVFGVALIAGERGAPAGEGSAYEREQEMPRSSVSFAS